VLGQAHHEGRHQQSLDVRVLAGDVERVAVIGAVVLAVRRAWLDRVRDQPVVDEFQLGDMRRLGESRVDRGLVAQRPDVAGVVGRDVVQHRGALLGRLHGVDHRGQHVVAHLDLLGRVARLFLRLGDDDGHMVADVAHLALREHRVRRLLHGLAVDVGDQPAAGQPAELGCRRVLAGVHGKDARRLFRLVRLDRLDRRVRVRRAHEGGVALVRQRHVVRVLPCAGEKAIVFLALDARADERCGHDGLLTLRRPWPWSRP
jgi:hypothetical protein